MEVIVDDEYVEKMGSFFKENYNELHYVIKEYKRIMQWVVEEGIKSGEIHDALIEFINQVSMSVNSDGLSAAEIGSAYNRYCYNYISDLDSADGDLY